MECKFDIDRDAVPSTIRIAGRLTAAHVPDLMQVWLELSEASQRTVLIDLEDLMSTDAIGVEALRRVAGEGAVLANASPYIQMKLEPSPSDRTW